MYTFSLQSDTNGFMDDFVNETRLSIDFHNWMYPDNAYSMQINTMDALKSDDLQNCIPVGSVEYVEKFLQAHGIPYLPAINIPVQLHVPKFLKRSVQVGTYKDIQQLVKTSPSPLFIKPATRCKLFDGHIIMANDISDIPQNVDLFISEPINITSEWRVFVHKVFDSPVILGARPYNSQPCVTSPDWTVIEEMIHAYTESPPAYTMDVAVTDKNNTVLLEVHNFLACGLYGFDSTSIPSMIYRSYSWQLHNSSIQ